MNYPVVWLDEAFTELANLYLRVRAQGHSAVFTAATSEIEQFLIRDPATQGESRGGRIRILVVPPLAVEFQVLEERNEVLIRSVRYSPPRHR